MSGRSEGAYFRFVSWILGKPSRYYNNNQSYAVLRRSARNVCTVNSYYSSSTQLKLLMLVPSSLSLSFVYASILSSYTVCADKENNDRYTRETKSPTGWRRRGCAMKWPPNGAVARAYILCVLSLSRAMNNRRNIDFDRECF